MPNATKLRTSILLFSGRFFLDINHKIGTVDFAHFAGNAFFRVGGFNHGISFFVAFGVDGRDNSRGITGGNVTAL